MKPDKFHLTMMLIFTGGLCMVLYAIYGFPAKPERLVAADRMLCYDLHTEFLDQEGWRRATPADRPHIVQLAERGLLEWREEKSLQCHDALDPAKEWLAGELWFRAKVKRAGEGTAYEGGA